MSDVQLVNILWGRWSHAVNPLYSSRTNAFSDIKVIMDYLRQTVIGVCFLLYFENWMASRKEPWHAHAGRKAVKPMQKCINKRQERRRRIYGIKSLMEKWREERVCGNMKLEAASNTEEGWIMRDQEMMEGDWYRFFGKITLHLISDHHLKSFHVCFASALQAAPSRKRTSSTRKV